ncbi:MAG TPA: hypothetical protein VMW72_24785 [Sedimentisphaerales bacterium]|nr:hypothetical protein [Sedimentisphaerales bacterium]
MVFEGNEIDASVLDGFTITGGASSRTWVPPDAEFARAGGASTSMLLPRTILLIV